MITYHFDHEENRPQSITYIILWYKCIISQIDTGSTGNPGYPAGCPSYLHRLGVHGDQQAKVLGHAVQQVGRDARQTVVGELAGREDVHHIRGLPSQRHIH